MAYVMPYQRPDYRESLDRDRPHELLDEDLKGPTTLAPNKRRYLRYRYLDTGECITVPNVHYNVTPAMKVADMRWQASEKERKAAALRAKAPEDWTSWMAAQVAERLELNAKRMREVAEGIECGRLSFNEPWELVTEDSPPRSSDPNYTPPRRCRP